MRALPVENLRLGARRIGKPERGAVVMRDGEAKAFRRKTQTRDGRRGLETAYFTLFRAPSCKYLRGLAGRPGDGAVGPERDLIDPTFLVVGGEDFRSAVNAG